MSVYFCLDDVFETLSLRDPDDNNIDDFVPVSTKAPECNGYKQDALILASRPQMLDLTDPDTSYQMATLLEDIPSYRKNLEALMDDALTQRHHNQLIATAISKAFHGQVTPIFTIASGDILDLPKGGLRHAALRLLKSVDLCKAYIKFMVALPHGHDQFSFERFVLRDHAKPYHDQFDGFITESSGKVKAAILLGFGTRADYDPRQPIENYVENGKSKALAMRISEPRELVWAWMESDHYQMRRCHDIERMITLRGLPRMPNWVRTDTLNCLEKESMKHVFAKQLIELDPSLSIIKDSPALQDSILQGTRNQMDDNLESLLSYILNPSKAYGGFAEKFYSEALLRQRESRGI